MTDSLSLSCSLSSRFIPQTGQPHLVYLLLEVNGGEGSQALPLNVGMIIDASDSMRIRLVSDHQFAELARQGQAKEILTDGVPAFQITSVATEAFDHFPRRIDYVAKALVIASELIRPADRFSLVAFAGQARTLIASSPGNDRWSLKNVAQELENIKLGNETQMALGLELAFEEIQRGLKRQYSNRLIMLTDGHTLNVSDCYDWARKAQNMGITLTTMGIGNEFNEELLIPLADLTGGKAYYIERPEQIPAALQDELGSALRVSYRNIAITLKCPEAVVVRRVYRVLPEMGLMEHSMLKRGLYRMALSDYDPLEPRALLMELIIPPWKSGAYRLLQGSLSWDNPHATDDDQEQRPRLSTIQDVMLEVSEAPTQAFGDPRATDSRVLSYVDKVGAFRMGSTALEAAQDAVLAGNQEDKEKATQRLRQAASRLIEMGETSLANAMYQQADILERYGKIDPTTTKQIRYQTRRMAQQQ